MWELVRRSVQPQVQLPVSAPSLQPRAHPRRPPHIAARPLSGCEFRPNRGPLLKVHARSADSFHFHPNRYIFLNELEFTDEFKAHTSAIASGKTSYGLVPREHWDDIPEYIDMEKATALMEEMGRKPIPYGGEHFDRG